MKIFKKKHLAEQYIEQTGTLDLLFQYDISRHNPAKEFYVGTFQQVYEIIKSGNNFFYESFRKETNVNLAFDLDINDP
jgi:hypothetical protein